MNSIQIQRAKTRKLLEDFKHLQEFSCFGYAVVLTLTAYGVAFLLLLDVLGKRIDTIPGFLKEAYQLIKSSFYNREGFVTPTPPFRTRY